MPQTALWRPMTTAPQIVDRIWLHHLTLGAILAEGRSGRWYSPSRSHQVWRWYRETGDDALDPFTGWRPFDGEGDPDAAAQSRKSPA
ncbi:hypothetical protein [Methylobacterium marchantiae]|uniref:Uncharacterized protein n=1 Tax=Methylobacterium marchantiae TaxID=600331 RepID=A0ABW3X4L0_9HYPH|nr:hypothetical protein AIGOOFII_2934 [Methylobacterium marchantiae]